MNSLCQVGFTDKGYRCVCRNGFEGESCKGIEPYTNCLTPGVWRVLWISSDYGDDRIGAKSKKMNGLKINPPLPRPKKKYHTELRGRHTRAPSDCQITQENICKIFLPPKIPESKISNLKISSEFPRHLKSRVTPPAPPPPPPRA